MAKKERRLEKSVNYETGVVTVKVLSTGQELVCDTNLLPEGIKAKLIPLAINHRIGDSAAGLDGAEAFDSMKKVWDGLVAGNFSIRQPAKVGISKSAITEKLASLTGKEATAAAELLKKLGIEL